MTMPTTEATAQRFWDRIAPALMLLAAFGALSSFVGAVGTVYSAAPDTQVAESWRMWGFLVFAGLFTLLALAPRSYPGIWELVILHKTATALTAATLVTQGDPTPRRSPR